MQDTIIEMQYPRSWGPRGRSHHSVARCGAMAHFNGRPRRAPYVDGGFRAAWELGWDAADDGVVRIRTVKEHT